MNSVQGTAALPAVGFPIRTSPDQSLVSGSPTLFAATHVLLRLLSPRHPSCALCSLVISLPSSFNSSSRRPGSNAAPWLTGKPRRTDTFLLPTCAYAVFKDRCSVSQNQTASPRDCETAFDLCCSSRCRQEKLLRKEVIQPQVPLRLPCYDFTPVTSHSLGAAFPCGLGKPLLEQLTPMV